MTVRAKFQCNSITPGWSEGQKTVSLNAVYSTDGENETYSTATPSGSLTIVIDPSTPAVDFFERGKYYYIDFSEAK